MLKDEVCVKSAGYQIYKKLTLNMNSALLFQPDWAKVMLSSDRSLRILVALYTKS
jgi:hypothetical protein